MPQLLPSLLGVFQVIYENLSRYLIKESLLYLLLVGDYINNEKCAWQEREKQTFTIVVTAFSNVIKNLLNLKIRVIFCALFFKIFNCYSYFETEISRDLQEFSFVLQSCCW